MEPQGSERRLQPRAVAAANGQPLLQITCGDLGLNPKEVDAALKECFYYAQHWRAVLLLDECDIFLQQRSKMDVKRNALVSSRFNVRKVLTKGAELLTSSSLSQGSGILYRRLVSHHQSSGCPGRSNQIPNNLDLILPALELVSDEGNLEDQYQACGKGERQRFC